MSETKPSYYIRPRMALEVLRAGAHAWKLQRTLNRFVVITFDCPLGDELRPQRLFREIRRKAVTWLYYKRRTRFMDPLTDVRTWEHVGDRYHVNWALHVPPGYEDEFETKLSVWIEKVMGTASREDYWVGEAYHAKGLIRYMLKGTDPAYAPRAEIRPSFQGEVWGRRAAVATCLGRAARARDRENGTV